MTLGIAILGISVSWVRATLKEGNKAHKENQKENLNNYNFIDLGTKQSFEKNHLNI